MTQMQERHLHEECGVFGVYSKERAALAQLCYFGLYALQHRGQESAGIVINDDGVFTSHKDTGLVGEVFTPDRLAALGDGNIAVAHVRYATTGSDSRRNAQHNTCDSQCHRPDYDHDQNNEENLQSPARPRSILLPGVPF